MQISTSGLLAAQQAQLAQAAHAKPQSEELFEPLLFGKSPQPQEKQAAAAPAPAAPMKGPVERPGSRIDIRV